MQITVIIVNYKTKELTAKAIQSVFDKTEGVEYEITVVDNASCDGSVEYLKERFGDKIKIIESKENLGFGRANNVEIRQSNAKYVFLLNSDTELLNNAIKIFYDYMEQNSDVGVCGGNLFDINGYPAESFQMYESGKILKYFYYRYLELFQKFIFKKYKYSKYRFNYTDKIKCVGSVIGADMFIRQETLKKSGLFDENIFMYAEDNDFCYRIKSANFNIISIPSAKIMHFESKSSNDYIAKYERLFLGTYYVDFKHYGGLTYFKYLDNYLTYFGKFIVSLFSFDKVKIKNNFKIFKLNIKIYKQTKSKIQLIKK